MMMWTHRGTAKCWTSHILICNVQLRLSCPHSMWTIIWHQTLGIVDAEKGAVNFARDLKIIFFHGLCHGQGHLPVDLYA